MRPAPRQRYELGMVEERWEAVDSFIFKTLHEADPVLDAALSRARSEGLPPIEVAPNMGKLLYILAASIGATRILEIGALGGYSTIWLARALPADGRLISLELEAHHAEVARANLKSAGLAERVEVRVGPALSGLVALAGQGAEPFDLVFIDADKPSYPSYFERSMELVRRGSLVVADNAVRAGSVADGSREDPGVQGPRRMLELMGSDRRVEATVIQTVGVKGYDGFAIALVVS